MYFHQAISKPLVNAVATMCGLVVPIALAHVWCALVDNICRPPLSELQRFLGLMHAERTISSIIRRPHPNDDPKQQQNCMESGQPRERRMTTRSCLLHVFLARRRICGRSWATSCGGCFETKLNVDYCSKNASVHVFSVWLVAFVF